jgi:S-adenosylmethionine hydrolase
VHIDRFGNAITNLDAAQLESWSGRGVSVRVGKRALGPLRLYYQAVGAGQPLALISSTGFLEIAVNGGDAAATLGLKIGSPVAIERPRSADRGRLPRR